jgi:hypothetical protein
MTTTMTVSDEVDEMTQESAQAVYSRLVRGGPPHRAPSMAARLRILNAAMNNPTGPEAQELRRHEREWDYRRDLKRYTDHRRRYPIRCCSAKERPCCRRWIVAQGLRPYPAAEAWDGFSALDRDGRHTFLSDGMKAQLRRMVVEGYFRVGQVVDPEG